MLQWKLVNHQARSKHERDIFWAIALARPQFFLFRRWLSKIQRAPSGICRRGCAVKETIGHFFVECPVVRQVWDRGKCVFGLFSPPDTTEPNLSDPSLLLGLPLSDEVYSYQCIVSVFFGTIFDQRNSLGPARADLLFFLCVDALAARIRGLFRLARRMESRERIAQAIALAASGTPAGPGAVAQEPSVSKIYPPPPGQLGIIGERRTFATRGFGCLT
jgi:hypothetical protein